MRVATLGVLCLAIVWLLPTPRSADADPPVDPLICGWVVTGVCPGCSPSTPTDSTCACGINGEACDCVKQTGGVQNGTIITCNTGDFTYNASMNGFVLTQTDEVWCKRVQRCRWDNGPGHELACAQYSEGECTSINECEWTLDSHTEHVRWDQGTAKCKKDQR